MRSTDSKAYLDKKSFFDKILTIYGRNAVLEALQDEGIDVYRLHLSDSNKPASVLTEIRSLAKTRGVEEVYHDKKTLSRISKNAKQDQGVALDIILPHSGDLEHFLGVHDAYRIIALDGVTNPQNLGMIIRSCAAGEIDAFLLCCLCTTLRLRMTRFATVVDRIISFFASSFRTFFSGSACS